MGVYNKENRLPKYCNLQPLQPKPKFIPHRPLLRLDRFRAAATIPALCGPHAVTAVRHHRDSCAAESRAAVTSAHASALAASCATFLAAFRTTANHARASASATSRSAARDST